MKKLDNCMYTSSGTRMKTTKHFCMRVLKHVLNVLCNVKYKPMHIYCAWPMHAQCMNFSCMFIYCNMLVACM